MGAWGSGAFDNDTACEWTEELTDSGVSDLSLVERTLSSAQEVDDDELDAELACEAIAACEVVARLQGRGAHAGAPLAELDAWIKSKPVKPSPALIRQAANVLDRVVANSSELADQWEDSGAWLSSVHDLRKRVAG